MRACPGTAVLTGATLRITTRVASSGSFGTGPLATVYNGNGGVVANPLVADAAGFFNSGDVFLDAGEWNRAGQSGYVGVPTPGQPTPKFRTYPYVLADPAVGLYDFSYSRAGSVVQTYSVALKREGLTSYVPQVERLAAGATLNTDPTPVDS